MLPLPTIAQSTREIMHMCVAAVESSGGDGGWLDDQEFGVFTEVGEVRVAETLVSSVVVAASLLNQMAQHRQYYEQHTASVNAEEAALQLTCCRAMRVLLKEWTRQRRAKWSSAKLIPLDNAQLLVWQAIQWFSLYPLSASDMIKEDVVSAMVPAIQLHVKEMSESALQATQLVGEGEDVDVPPGCRSYFPSEDLSCCLEAFSNLLEQYEERASDTILENGVAVEILGVLFQYAEHRELVPVIVTILHRISCTDVSACNELIECGADAVRTYGLRGYAQDGTSYKLSSVDWLVEHLTIALEARMGMQDDEQFKAAFGPSMTMSGPSSEEGSITLAVLTTQLADTLSNLCRVHAARERVVGHHGALLSVMCEALIWDLKYNEGRMREEVVDGWSYGAPVEAGLVPTLSALLSLVTILAPSMYNSISGEGLSLPLNLVPASLFVAANCPDIKCVDQVSSCYIPYFPTNSVDRYHSHVIYSCA